MLNEDKIKLMTKLAIYEQGTGKKAIKSNNYSKSNYVSLNMIKSALAVTVAYIIIVVLFILNNAEAFINQLISVKLLNMAIRIIVLYVIVFTIYLLITYVISSMRYIRMQEMNRKYSEQLKELYMMYKREEKVKSEMKIGGEESDDGTFEY